jgi:acyl-CoA dehydrogenase
MGGWLMARGSDVAATRLAEDSVDREFLEAKLASAYFYSTQVLPQVRGLEQILKSGSDAVVSADVALI